MWNNRYVQFVGDSRMPHTMERERFAPSDLIWFIDGVSVAQLFEDVYSEFRRRASERGVRLRFDVIEWEPILVAADRCALRNSIEAIVVSALSARGVQNVTLRAFPRPD